MKPTRILLVLVRLAAAIVPFAVSGCYVTPPSVSFYPPPPPRPVGITDRSSPNFYVLHQHRLASPPRGYVGDSGSGGGSNGDNSNGGAQNGSNQNGVSGGNSGNGGDSGSGGGWSGDPNNGNGGSGGGSNGGNSNGNGGDQNGVSGGNSNGDPYGNGGGIPSGPPPVPPAAPSQATCAQGYVWREASSTDFVCVTPNARALAAYDNSQASARSAGGGDYGADTCVQGYVWREAFAGDHVCVTPQTRSQTASDNSQADSRLGSPSTPNFDPNVILPHRGPISQPTPYAPPTPWVPPWMR
jgi:hypothetical protein